MPLRLSRALEDRDPYQRGHAERVTALALAVARRLGWDGESIEALRVAAALHDVGKLAIPPAVLQKREPLTEEELARVRLHPQAGVRLLDGLPAPPEALPLVLHHHERWDGRGYPGGLAGEAIPPGARILAVADAFDAMTTARPYRSALSPQRALRELRRCAGSQFDPVVTEAFLEAWSAGDIGGLAEAV